MKLKNDLGHLSMRTFLPSFCFVFFLRQEERRGKEGGGSEGEKERRGGQIWGRQEQTQRKKTHSFTQSFLVKSSHDRSVRLWTTAENGHIWSTTDRRDTLWPLGSNMPNTPTWQTISQCFTSRLHYCSNWSQHAGQAILAYQPLLNLSPFPIKGIMRVLQMQKFHQLKFTTYCMSEKS